MNGSKRKKVIAGNWKMNKTAAEAATLIESLIPAVKDAECEVVILVPFLDISTAIKMCEGTNIRVGAQNCHFAESGAFTGEISVPMLIESGVEFVIVGHSERRQYFGETDDSVNKKAKSVIENGLYAIVCVGESLEERETGDTEKVVGRQVKAALFDVSSEHIGKIIIAYEPVWAIGTGKTATPEQAQEVCKFIRKTVKNLYSDEIAEKMVIQYGGSMNPGNAEELLALEDVDGGLIGGASLKADDFKAIVDAANV
ncbi:MAG: triose-phosphate isomerase [Ruminococcaceae bacterium]|nr:triose-phosphate isomerase [Oscillospiraceae bacterium]